MKHASQDCDETRFNIIALFCHDFGMIINCLEGYIFLLEDSIDNPQELGEFLKIAKESRIASESGIQAVRNYIDSTLQDCGSVLGDFFDQFEAMYNDHFVKWHIVLDNLDKAYIRAGHLDMELMTQLRIHTKKLRMMRDQLLDDILQDN